MAQLYTYEPLDPFTNDIRLLLLAPGDWDQQIKCELVQTDLSGHPEYETISYCWGSPDDRSAIYVDGLELFIPSSAFRALRRMRRGSHGPRTLWIDAVCINQLDVHERSHQVLLMSHIHRQTRQNLVYLGDDQLLEQGTRSVLSILREIHEQTHGLRELRAVLFAKNNALRVAQNPIRATFDIEALGALLSNPWFSRLWVLQEVSLAPQSICHCGDVQIALLDILLATLWLRYKHRFLPPSLGTLQGLINAAMLWEFVDDVRGSHREVKGRPSVGMLEMLKVARNLDTRDPRDRVFACLGMLKCTASLRGVPIELKPDYEIDARRIFSSATRIAFHESGLDQLLNLVSHRGEQASLHDVEWPSWMPRWSTRRNMMDDPWSFDAQISAAGAVHLVQHNPLVVHRDLEELRLRGFIFDRVRRSTTPFLHRHTSTAATLLDWLCNAGNIACKAAERARRHGAPDPRSALSSCLFADVDASRTLGKGTNVSALEAFKAYKSRHGEMPHFHRANNILDPELDATALYSSLRQVCPNRRIFSTETGHLGLGPSVDLGGALIVVFHHCRLPYVLCKTKEYHEGDPETQSETYRMMGPCYVHGIMQGEFAEKCRLEGVADQEFVIT